MRSDPWPKPETSLKPGVKTTTRTGPHSPLGGLAPEEYGRAMNEDYQNGQSPNLRLAYSAG